MVPMNEQLPSPPPPPPPIGQGDKYALVKSLLRRKKRVTVEAWIRNGRDNGQSYYTLADELNTLFRAEEGKENAASAPRVTFESIRRWDPDGEYQRKAQAQLGAAATQPEPASSGVPDAGVPTSGVAPVQFQAGDE